MELATDDELADCFDDTLRSYEWYLDSGYELFSYDEVNALGRKALEAEWYRRRQQRLGVAAG